MAAAVAEGIIERLSTPDLQHIREAWGINDELERLKNKVSDIKAMLSNAEEQNEVSDVKAMTFDRAVRDPLFKAKDVIYDADDFLDELFTVDLQSKVMTRKSKVLSLLPTPNSHSNSFKISPNIKVIINKLEDIENVSKSVHLGKRPVETQVRNWMSRETDPFLDAKAVIGRDADKEDIIGLLLDSNSNVKENVSIIPIVGEGGLGKTTLAQFVYNDDIVKKHFDLRMWVCVSERLNVKIIVKDIIKSAANKNIPENLPMYQLKNHLQQEINGKKYLIVLDNVWINPNNDKEKWHSLAGLLMCGAWGSRILITTRSEEVAKITGTVPPYMLEGMSDGDSWSLFKQIAFKHGQEPKNSRILEIGREIVSKCRGHPLCIRLIGGILYFKHSVDDWQSLLDNKHWKPSNDCYVLSVLKLSYIHLPSHLRGCFTYCALFPNDHKIDVQTLIYLWMAQGFILSSDPSQCLEDVGHGYFMYLFDRSFFEEVEKDEWGNIKRCKMHDLMHDLARFVAGVEISTLLYPYKENINDKRTRHVSLVFNLDSSRKIPSPLLEENRIRTFLLPCQSWMSYEEKLSKSTCDAIISTFKCLRVLDLHDLGIVALPSSLGKLKYLRYLDLSGNGIEMLPSSLYKLQNLQTLKLSYCCELKELPKYIERLINLRHLVIDGCDKLTHMPRGLGKLTSLRTLTKFVASKDGGPSELSNLKDLTGELEILHLQHLKGSISAANLKEKPYLQVLTLEWDEEVDDCEKSLEGLQPHQNLKWFRVRGYRGVKFIPSSLTNIVKFTLYNCPKCQYLPPFHQFPSLQILELLRLNALEYVADSDGKDEHSLSSLQLGEVFFPSLKELKLWDCSNLKGWWKSDVFGDARASFPALSKLEIMYCPNLTSIPPYPHLEEQLILSSARAKPLLETVMNMAAPQGSIAELASTSSSTPPSFSFSPLSRLRLLRIDGNEELKSLPEEWLRNLTSLQRLGISECSKLEFLSNGIQHLASLQNLDIRDCEALTLCNDEDDGMQWQYLKSLRSLTIWGIPNLSSLPAGLQRVSSLETLNLSNCPSLVALPEWIGSLASLRRLVISKCRKLASLPQGIRKLTSLRRLVIDDCPILLKRCQWEIGEDWPKIAHIPFIEENATYVDSD